MYGRESTARRTAYNDDGLLVSIERGAPLACYGILDVATELVGPIRLSFVTEGVAIIAPGRKPARIRIRR